MMEGLTIAPCNKSEVAHLFEAGESEFLSFVSNTDFHVARVDEEIVGFCGIVWGPTAPFKNNYVLPAFRGRGIAKSTLAYRIEILKQSGRTKARANTKEKSTPYYVSAGFQVTKQFKHCAIVALDLGKPND